MSSQPDTEEFVVRILLEFDDVKVVTRETRSEMNFRLKFLQRIACAARMWIELYEQRLPPLERQSWRQREAFSEYTMKVYESVSHLVMKIDPWMGKDWGDSVTKAREMSFAECEEVAYRRVIKEER